MCVVWLTPVTWCSVSVRRAGKAMPVMFPTVPRTVAIPCEVCAKSVINGASATLAGKVGLFLHASANETIIFPENGQNGTSFITLELMVGSITAVQ